MKKIVVIALSLVMMMALTVAGSAAAMNSADFTVNDNADWFNFKDDGSVEVAYNTPDVWWANLGMTLKDPKYTQGGSYTVEVKAQLPENQENKQNGTLVSKGCYGVILALNTKEDTVNSAHLSGGLFIKLVDYTDDPVYGVNGTAGTNLGTAVEIFDWGTAANGQPGAVTLKDGVTFADLNIKNGDGLYNTIKAEVKNYKATVSVNGVVVLENYDISTTKSNGELISLCTNGNPPSITDTTRVAAFKDLVVTDADNKIIYGAQNTDNAGTGSSNPNTADADIIMYSGMALLLLTVVVSTVAVRRRSSVK